jgi:hypothetical protein
VGYDDLTIDMLFEMASVERAAGTTEQQAILSYMAGCRGEPPFGGGCPANPNIGPDFTLQQCILDCTVCGTAVIREVY